MNRNLLKLGGILLITVAFLIVVMNTIQNEKSTTYEKEVAKLIGEESVKSISILVLLGDKSNKYVEIHDEKLIQKLIDLPKEMELEEIDETSLGDIHITLRTTDWRDIRVSVSDDRILIGNQFYKINGENILLQIINDHNIDWDHENFA
jgi:hypothetical protein